MFMAGFCRMRPSHPAALAPLTLIAALAVVAGCGGPAAEPAPRAAVLADPTGVQVAGGATPQQVAAAVSAALFASAPVAVVATPGDPAAVTSAARAAVRLGAPMLLSGTAPAPPTDPAALEVARLQAHDVLVVGPLAVSGTTLGGAHIVRAEGDGAAAVQKAIADLPATLKPAPMRDTTVLVRTAGPAGTGPGAGSSADVAAAPAVRATATAAGAAVVPVAAADPRTDPAAIAALAKHPTGPVLAAGSGFGPAATLASRVAVARTGVQLPGGGQVMFPGRALVALYGHPGNTALGVLGQQDPAASVTRAQQVAAPYQGLYTVPVIPTFEIIAAVASSCPGSNGDCSNEFPVAKLQPDVDAITQAGGYVVLDLQPGRANVLDLAKKYEPLLVRPNVGLAIDPEWALKPGQQPLQQIGSLDASQINPVYDWLSSLVATDHLPQKVLVLHQFRLDMLADESQLRTGDDQIAVVIHADGQGPRAQKEATWRNVTHAAPPGVWFGWKNFYKEDPQLASPQATVDRIPKPVMISYQ